VGISYSRTITASGGTSPYWFMVISGSLPPGLTLNPNTGVLAGTPTSFGSFMFVIRATDSHECTGILRYSLTIDCPTINLNPHALANGRVGYSYSQTITASGGTSPYSFIVISGSLPPVLTLNQNTGVLAGTPTSKGSFMFTIQADDSYGCSGTWQYHITVKKF